MFPMPAAGASRTVEGMSTPPPPPPLPPSPPPSPWAHGPVPGGYGPPPGPPPVPATGSRWSVPLLAGLAVSVAGFFVELSYSSYSSENGVVTDCDYHDFSGLLFGPAAVVLGLVAAARSRRGGARAGAELGLGFLCVALGALHVLRGLGVVDIDLTGSNPCA
jgi:hypothetical protein